MYRLFLWLIVLFVHHVGVGECVCVRVCVGRCLKSAITLSRNQLVQGEQTKCKSCVKFH